MIRYYIRPVGRDNHTEAWADTLAKAKEIKAHLQTVTGLKWKITKEQIGYDNTV
ncbi:hypothetical protein [Muribaculum intestinale]|jgi:hypothetical protein|uniref:hypothetical protein n=1 Tax=Muribaculum intestinale TaxID=1796646 RepID=UPI0025B3B970|nr:hypothetical protein [Muribaculum intestinale]